ncbi:mitochondrial ribosome assembly protein [Histoplasma capsulatum var. duboisii H88]|uniref:Mitochondrial GTPase 1 n=2 Tax=Ajellomyces capsulatus TaxID=5037 RepID=F0UM40_AJEC8|nr:mitochondrial ribosome assembly protein [Histoplasma capsulatum H143]EGC47237.1 mitochondrial ribosome assembly protein [Histoplasma capsulatum var. duboisii H88]QSS53412.1 mitochondrial ribosome assembly protein [Histoplasma capsulatum var. duboisii H88]
MASIFVPRSVFPKIDSIPRTYFLGHHKAGLEKMKKMLSSIDHVIECRDFRIPATSINPAFEEALSGKRRWIVYTKRDLGGDLKLANQRNEARIQQWHRTSKAFFTSRFDNNTIVPIVKALRSQPFNPNKLTGARIMVVGMPNIGKSSLINALRNYVMKKGKAAKTGADPGVTRRVGGGIKILERAQGSVYVHDTPGVFMPYMPDSESMLKLALCGCVKHTIIPSITLADYLLYQVNLHKPRVYEKYSPPTNDIIPFLESFSAKTGCFAKGGVPDLDAAARKMVHMYREGKFGAFIMDNILDTTLKLQQERLAAMGGSINQAKKAEKLAKKERQMETVEVV